MINTLSPFLSVPRQSNNFISSKSAPANDVLYQFCLWSPFLHFYASAARAGLSQLAAELQLCFRVNFPSLSRVPLSPCPSPSFPFPSPSFHSLPSPPSPRCEPAPLKRARGSGDRYPSGVQGRAPAAVAFCRIVCSQNASGCSISGSLVSIAMSGKMKSQPRVQNGGPPKVGGPVRPNTFNMSKAGPVRCPPISVLEELCFWVV